MFSTSFRSARTQKARQAQRDAPARANAGPQLVNKSDPTMNRTSGAKMAPILDATRPETKPSRPKRTLGSWRRRKH